MCVFKKYLEKNQVEIPGTFPVGTLVKRSSYSAGDEGSISFQGTGIPYAAEQLKPVCRNY